MANPQSLDWYLESRFGMFIHWGAYAAAGVEASWSMMAPDLSEAMFGTTTRISEAEYQALPAQFNPFDFDAEGWVHTAQKAGMRYIVMTAKHHDGFCMFDAPGTDYKITKTSFGRDVCKEMADACHAAGMPLGFYYSPPDMHHPGYRDIRKPVVDTWTGEPNRKEWASYLDYMETHLRKLLSDYGPISIIWFDGLTNMGKYDPARFHSLVHSLSPQTLINDRLGGGFDFITPEQFIPKDGIPVRTGKPPAGIDPGGDGFFRLVVQMFKVPGLRGWVRKQMQKYQDGTMQLAPVLQEPYPSPERFQPWETCMTIGGSWGYNPKETAWKSSGELVRNLVRVASRGGNYLLNVGPTGWGAFPTQVLERLNSIGQWMKVHGEAIYGSTYTPLQNQPWGEATRKGSQIYLHIFDWPVNTNWPNGPRLEIADFPVSAQAVRLMEDGSSLSFSQNGSTLEVILPLEAPDPDVSVLVVDFTDPNQNLTRFSPTKETRLLPLQYLWAQSKGSLVINTIINGLIALLTYRLRPQIPFGEAAVDILITTGIIAWLVSWLVIGSARSEVIKGNIALSAQKLGPKLPWSAVKGPGLRAWLITLAFIVIFGGLVLDGALYLLAPSGLSGWGYIIFKTLYTGVCAGLACAAAIQSVFVE